MMEMLRGFPAVRNLLLDLPSTIWFEHHHFYKRYALQDQTTMALNTLLLFVILFYVYPLKFMFTLFTQNILGQKIDLPAAGVPFLYTIYGLGVMSVFWLLAAMYGHAWRQRAALAAQRGGGYRHAGSGLRRFLHGPLRRDLDHPGHSPWSRLRA